ncbi:MAG: Ion-translocating oxidoreductase complex subunit, partial [Massilia sp.]|nr:Ion-translocating oxidoreductase complex subunit [Massilia sp.]
AKLREVNAEVTNTPQELAEKERKRAIIAAAMERARAKAATPPADSGNDSAPRRDKS